MRLFLTGVVHFATAKMAAIMGNLKKKFFKLLFWLFGCFCSSTSCQCCEGTSAAYTHTDTVNITFQRAPGTKIDQDQHNHNLLTYSMTSKLSYRLRGALKFKCTCIWRSICKHRPLWVEETSEVLDDSSINQLL